MFVTIHGIDGTGKTTAAYEVTQRMRQRGSQSETVASLEDIYGAEYSLPTSLFIPHTLNEMSLLKRIRQTEMVRRANAVGITVLRDRWLIDTYADSAHRRIVLPEVPTDSILQPNLSVILLCDENVRQQRIAARGNPSPEDLIPKEAGTRAKFFEEYLLRNIGAFAARTMIIDTTDLMPTQVAEKVLFGITEEQYA